MMPVCELQKPSYFFELVAPYRDKVGLITQRDDTMDGGDAAHRTGVFYFGLSLIYENNPELLIKIKKRFLVDFSKLKKDSGIYVRHPDKYKWYSNPNNFSRDQSVSLILALGAFGETNEVTSHLSQLIKNYGFYPNRLKNWTNEEKKFPFDYQDIVSPSDWGMFIRALNEIPYYHLLYFTDLQLLGNALIRIIYSRIDSHDTSDDINFTMLLLQSQKVMPTFISKSAIWIYSRFRKNSEFIDKYKGLMPVMTAWDYYYEHVAVRPRLNKIYQCILEKKFYHDVKNRPPRTYFSLEARRTK